MGWEWRYFVFLESLPVAGPEQIPLAGKREDIYFPASKMVGLKLRHGQGMLEAKLCKKARPIAGRGNAEKWDKSLHGGCVEERRSSGGHSVPYLIVEAVAGATRWREDELFEATSTACMSLRVHVRKNRKHTATGESTELVIVVYDEGSEVPLAIERWHTVSVEIRGFELLSEAVLATELPEGALVTGYPGLVATIASRIAQEGKEPGESSVHGELGTV